MRKAITLPKLKNKALTLFAELTKLRAAHNNKLYCYTCSKPLVLGSSDTQLGHYLSRGAYPGLTFHPDNSRPQDYRCNVMLHGNIIEFRERLIAEIGIERVEKLESSRHESIKLTRSDYEEMIKIYSEEIAELKNNM